MPLLLAAAALVAAGVTDAELRVESVDVSSYPAVSLVLSASELEVADPATGFDVTRDGTALPVEAEALPPWSLEVVLLVGEPAPGIGEPEIRSILMDFVLRLPADARVAIVGADPDPRVLAEPGGTVQRRVLVASQATPAEPALDEGLALAVRQFTRADDRMRAVVMVGGAGEEAAVPEDLADEVAERHVAVHAVEEAGAADGLITRLSNLYRLEFEVSEGVREVTVRLAEHDRPAAVTVPLDVARTPADPPGEPSPRAEGDERPPATPTGTAVWVPILLALAAVGVMALSVSIVLPGVRGARRDRPSTGSWERSVAQIEQASGGAEGVGGVAERVAEERREAAAEIRSIGWETRLAATVLAAQPVVVGVLLLIVGRDAVQVSPGYGSLATVAALLLAVGGAAWLRRVARPPFSPWPRRWKAHAREDAALRDVADALDLARHHAATGLPLDESLARAGAGQEHPARRVVEQASTGDTGNAPAGDALAAASRAVRSEQVAGARAKAQGGITATAVPFLLCTLPATALLLVAVSTGLAGG